MGFDINQKHKKKKKLTNIYITNKLTYTHTHTHIYISIYIHTHIYGWQIFIISLNATEFIFNHWWTYLTLVWNNSKCTEPFSLFPCIPNYFHTIKLSILNATIEIVADSNSWFGKRWNASHKKLEKKMTRYTYINLVII